ncbi:MAG: 50S ribosomal protein L18 [Kiritimatiellae bacterium]|nr:50S ribosomal protein L18 [Kiritimatiellia bacterium]
MSIKTRLDYRKCRHVRLRKKVKGTNERPRMSVLVSNKNMYIQFIDDEKSVTIAYASSIGKSEGGCNVEQAKILGKRAAELAIEKGVKSVVVDRGGLKFHGRVKAIVDAASEAGLDAGPRGGGNNGKDDKEEK